MYDLINSKHEFSVNFFDWGHILELALYYGWTPMGTILNDTNRKESWRGGYSSCDGQYVVPEDAVNIGKALEKALIDIPDSNFSNTINSEITGEVKTLDELAHLIFKTEREQRGLPLVSLLQKFSGKANKEYVEKLIAFCFTGEGFYIC